MKTVKYLFSLLTIVAALIISMPVMAKDKAKISFPEKTWNFGNIKEEGGPVSHEFTFSNTGDSNLVILDATAQCGCTRPEYPKNPIAPGKTSKIKVTYNPIGRPGAFEKVVTVKSNAGGKVRLKISGTVIPKK